MGYGIPAAVGAQLGCPDDLVVAVTGDGSLQMGMPELGTAKEQKLPLKILLLNNQYLGMVKQLQYSYCDRRYTAVQFTDNPEFKYFAKAYGAAYISVAKAEELPEAMAQFIGQPGMVILEAFVTPEENVYPMVVGDKGLDEMEM